MLGLYTPVFLLQAFCVYHAYRNNVEQRWYWLILFFPLFGCIIYLAQNFNSASTIKSLEENVKAVVISNYKTEQLEKASRFSDSFKNKVNLADEYMNIGRYAKAIQLYADSLQGFMSEDASLKMKLLSAHYMNADYRAAVQYGEDLKSEKTFQNSEVRVTYAWSVYQTGPLNRLKLFSPTWINHFQIITIGWSIVSSCSRLKRLNWRKKNLLSLH